MQRTAVIFILIFILCASCPVGAADSALENVLPSSACAPGWIMDEKVILYDKDTLFDRIDGEAELYFPYGFTTLAYARYASKENPQFAVDADIYKMGSLLDAFGMYANYRRKEDADVKIGAEGTVSSSQLFFYQGQYLVRLQATGISNLDQNVFLACARAISQNLPPNFKKPQELDAFMIPPVVQKSVRYIAQSFLGYDFFRRGLIGDAIYKGQEVQVFVIPEDSQEAARKAFDQYRSYLKLSDKDTLRTPMRDQISLKAVDPLYGNVMLMQTNRYLIGAMRVKDLSSVEQLIEQLKNRINN
jgi:hypothetical protein